MKHLRRLILALALSAGLAPAFAQVPPAVPALPDSERRISYSITATNCACSINFALYGDGTDFGNWIEVFLNGIRVNFNDATFGWTVTSPSGTIGSLARPITNAVLTFNAVQTGTVQIVGARRPRRTSQFNEGAGVPTRNFNQVLTDIIATQREVWDKNNDMTGRGLFSQPGNTVGLLPLPTACQNKFLGFDATGLNPLCFTGAGSGNVVGPLSSTDSNFALFNGTTGALLKDGGASTVIQNTTANKVWAGPTTGGAAAPAFRALVAADIPAAAAIALSVSPQMRITLNAGTPVMLANFAAQTTVFVTPYVGNLVPIYDGTNIIPTPFAEVSQATTDATKSPAAVAASSNYDIFCWVDTGPTNRCTRGPAWTSLTTRSAGTALVRVSGIPLNSVSITNGPAASRGTYMGTISSDASSQINYTFGGVSTGCTAAVFGVWNMYNRVPVRTSIGDTTASWTYTVANVTREIRGNTNCSISAVRGFDEDGVSAAYNGICLSGAATNQSNGIGLDSTTSFIGNPGYCASTTIAQMPRAEYSGLMGLGYHTFTANERQDTTTSSTWFGLVAANLAQSGMHVGLVQ